MVILTGNLEGDHLCNVRSEPCQALSETAGLGVNPSPYKFVAPVTLGVWSALRFATMLMMICDVPL